MFENNGNSWGVGGHQRPLGTEIPEGWGGANQKTFRGGGMNIFCNHTFCDHVDGECYQHFSNTILIHLAVF